MEQPLDNGSCLVEAGLETILLKCVIQQIEELMIEIDDCGLSQFFEAALEKS